MIRLTRRLTTDLLLWMLFFGLSTGVIFPFFVSYIQGGDESVLSPLFFFASIAAGGVVGVINFFIVRSIINPRLQGLSANIQQVTESLDAAQYQGNWENCDVSSCRVKVDSEDSVGELGASFNTLIETLFRVQAAEDKLRAFSDTITSRLDVQEVANTTIDFLLDKFHASGAALYVETAGELRTVASHGLAEVEHMAENERLLRALDLKDVQKIEIPDGLMLDGVVTKFRPTEVLLVPLRFRKQALGVLLIANAHPISDENLGLLSLLSNGLGLSLNNAIAHDQLEHIAALDALTGAYNRRFGLQRLEEEFSRASRQQSPLTLIMFDIDHFKRINDTYGHLPGDRVIKNVAQIAQSTVRSGDVVVRYGGEEFLAILPGASLSDAQELAERMRRKAEDTQCHEGQQQFGFTVSFGCCSYPETATDTAEELTHCADQALYQAKESGRNRVMPAIQ